MGSPDFRETFLYVASQLNRYDLAYLHVVDGLAFGFHKLGEPMTLAEFRDVFKGVPLLSVRAQSARQLPVVRLH
jgi:N-ethylmaleimide reductase